MKAVAVALLALFAFSIVASIPNAWSLSPITFDTVSTVESEEQQFPRVYEASAPDYATFLDTDNAGNYYRSHYSNYALQFNSASTQFVDMGNTLSYERTSAFTAGAWVKTSDSGAQTVMAKMGAGGDGWEPLAIFNGDLYFTLQASGGNVLQMRTTSSLDDGNWHHVAATYDGSSSASGVVIYIDGQSAALTTISNSLSASITNANNFRIGYRDTGQPFNGSIDDVFLATSVYTAAQIDAVYDGTAPSTNLDAYWHFNEGSGTTAYDDSGSDDGTLTNSPLYVSNVPDNSLASVAPRLDTTVTSGGDVTDSDANASPVDLSRYSLQLNGSTQYATASANTVYDVTTQDFWAAGLAYRSAIGTDDVILDKRDVPSNQKGYLVFFSSSNQLCGRLGDGSAGPLAACTSVNSAGSVNTWYAWGASWDRNANLDLYLYNLSSETLTTSSVSISSQQGSISNTATVNIGRDVTGSSLFIGNMDLLIPPQIGDTLSQAEFLDFAEDGTLPTGITNLYDFNEGITGVAIDDVLGSNNLTPQNSPTYSSNVATASLSRPSTYTIGRDAGTGNLIYGKLNLSDLSAVSAASQASSYHPRDIVQTTDTLYSPLIDDSDTEGIIRLGSISRSFTGYSEATTLHTGNSTVPSHAIMYNEASGTSAQSLHSATSTGVGEVIQAGNTAVGKTINGVLLRLDKSGSPTGTASICVLDSSNNCTHTFDTLNVATLTTSATDYLFYGPDYVVAANDRIGIKYSGGDGSNFIRVYYNNANSQTNAKAQQYNAGWNDINSGNAEVRGQMVFAHIQCAVYDGSPDTTYCFFESNANTIRAVKRTGSTTLLGTPMDHTTGQPFSVMQLTDKIIIQTATDVYTLTTATDAIANTFTSPMNTKPSQTYSISPASQSFSMVDQYVANSTVAYLYDPVTGSQTQTQVLIDSASAPTLGAYDPSKYYYLQQNDLTVEASSGSTTWTIKDVGTRNNYSITAYSEQVGVSLMQNNTLFSEGVLKLNCDSGVYQMLFPMFAVGDDSDCTKYRVTATASATVGREIYGPFLRTADLIHADTFTGYTFEVSQADPTVYRFYAEYDDKTIHVADFDSSGQILFPGLYGNCYDITIQNENSGSTILFGNVCANDAATKSLSLASIVIPDNWTGVTWFHNATRDYTNATNNSIRFDVMKNQQPYNVSVHIVDHPQVAYRTFDQWYNYTGQTGMTTITQAGFLSNQTVFITAYEDNTPVANDILGAQSYNIGNIFAPLGSYFGVPVVATVIVGVAAIWRRENAYFGVIVTMATAGILFVLGMFEVDPIFWAVIMVIGAVGVLVGVRRT